MWVFQNPLKNYQRRISDEVNSKMHHLKNLKKITLHWNKMMNIVRCCIPNPVLVLVLFRPHDIII